jgi:hypothetical protein
MTPLFEPSNDLERALVAALQNQLPVPAFVQTLQTSKIFVLLDRAPAPGKVWDDSVAPMVLSNAGKTPFLAIFTAPERAGAWVKRQTAFGVGLSTDFAGLLQGMAPNLGLVINPGLPVGFELQPATVAQLRAQTS